MKSIAPLLLGAGVSIAVACGAAAADLPTPIASPAPTIAPACFASFYDYTLFRR